ncbi:Hemin receptor [uncultured Gammaproteobacteria bacterium]
MNDEDVVEPPAGVGPHEGKELDLMLAGTKPLAVFSEDVPDLGLIPREQFAPYVEDGTFISREEKYVVLMQGHAPLEVTCVYYATPDQAWRIDLLHQLYLSIHQNIRPYTDCVDQEIGELLGYTELEIAKFLAWSKRPR